MYYYYHSLPISGSGVQHEQLRGCLAYHRLSSIGSKMASFYQHTLAHIRKIVVQWMSVQTAASSLQVEMIRESKCGSTSGIQIGMVHNRLLLSGRPSCATLTLSLVFLFHLMADGYSAAGKVKCMTSFYIADSIHAMSSKIFLIPSHCMWIQQMQAFASWGVMRIEHMRKMQAPAFTAMI